MALLMIPKTGSTVDARSPQIRLPSSLVTFSRIATKRGSVILFGEIAVDLGYTNDRTIREYLESRRRIGVLV